MIFGTPTRERDISIRPMLSGGKMAFRYTPALTEQKIHYQTYGQRKWFEHALSIVLKSDQTLP